MSFEPALLGLVRSWCTSWKSLVANAVEDEVERGIAVDREARQLIADRDVEGAGHLTTPSPDARVQRPRLVTGLVIAREVQELF